MGRPFSLFLCEVDCGVRRHAIMNLALRGIDVGLGSLAAVGLNKSFRTMGGPDPRGGQFGLAPKRNPNVAWTQCYIYQFPPQSVPGFVRANRSTSCSKPVKADIRRVLITAYVRLHNSMDAVKEGSN